MANSWKFYKETVTNRPVFEMQDGTKYYPVTMSEFATLVDLDAHINDTTDAHDASAISFAPAGTIAATDVQAAIEEVATEGGAPTTADYLVGTADAGLSNEIAVGTTPGGELGGTWASPTVDATHSGSAHADFVPLTAVPGDGQVLYSNGGVIAGEAEFIWDDTNNRLLLRRSSSFATAGVLEVSSASEPPIVVGNATTPIAQLSWITSTQGMVGGLSGTDFSIYARGGERILVTDTYIRLARKLYPVSPAISTQTAAGIFAGTGVPNNADGANGDFYFRSDGGALTTIYHKRVGAWVGII